MSKKILIIEDDTFLQGLAAKKLAASGYEVMTAGDSDQATKKLEEATPDFILLDLMLPGTDGYGVLKKIRENVKLTKTPVIIFSNLGEDADIKKAQDLGATDFMIKSNFTLDELVDKIKSIIG
jgi:DNA-binding response OmpR family regulator